MWSSLIMQAGIHRPVPTLARYLALEAAVGLSRLLVLATSLDSSSSLSCGTLPQELPSCPGLHAGLVEPDFACDECPLAEILPCLPSDVFEVVSFALLPSAFLKGADAAAAVASELDALGGATSRTLRLVLTPLSLASPSPLVPPLFSALKFSPSPAFLSMCASSIRVQASSSSWALCSTPALAHSGPSSAANAFWPPSASSQGRTSACADE